MGTSRLKLGIIGIIILIFIVPNVTAALTDGLIAYWHMDDTYTSGNTMIDKLGAYNGTIVGATTGVVGFINESYHYDGAGNDYVNVTTFNRGSDNEGTFSVWINTTAQPTDGSILFYNVNANNKISIKRDKATGKIDVIMKDAGATVIDLESDDVVNLSSYYHIILRQNGTIIDMWINGTNQSDTDSGEWFNEIGNTALHIGERPNLGNGFAGQIDEMAYWNRSLTNAEIASLYNAGTGFAHPFGAAPAADLTINLSSNLYQTVITTFNITANGTFYSTTTGQIVTNISADGRLVNITARACGMTTINYTNFNTTNTTPILKITPNSLTGLTFNNLSYTSTMVGDIITMSCSYTDSCNYTTTTRYLITNVDDSQNYTQAGVNYTILTTDYQDALNMWCKVNNTHNAAHSSKRNISASLIDQYVTFRALSGWSGAILANAYWVFSNGITSLTNPLTTLMSNFLNTTTNALNITVNATDLTYYHRATSTITLINETVDEYNFTLNPNQLIINFTTDAGVLTNTSGMIADEEMQPMNFTNSSIVIVQQDLAQGVVRISFETSNNINWTQFYEYNNTYVNHTAVELTILRDADMYGYVQIEDYGGNLISQANIYAYVGYPRNTLNNTLRLFGRRLTDDDGTALFYFDSASYVKFVVAAEGYIPTVYTAWIGDFNITKENPLVLRLQDTSSGLTDNIYLQLPRTFQNRSQNITGTLWALDRSLVQISTNYRIAQLPTASEYRSLSATSTLGQYQFTLISGTDFQSTGTGDITLHIKLDTIYTSNRTIAYDSATYTDLFSTSGLTNAYLVPLLVIFLALFTAGATVAFKNMDASIGVFAFGAILIGFVSSTFLWVAIPIMMIFIMRMLYRVVSE